MRVTYDAEMGPVDPGLVGSGVALEERSVDRKARDDSQNWIRSRGSVSILRMLLAPTLLMAIVPGIARASSQTECVLHGGNGSFQAAAIYADNGGASLGIARTDPMTPATGRDSYLSTLGAFVAVGTSPSLVAWNMSMGGSGSPRVVVQSSGSTVANQDIPGTRVSGVHGNFHRFSGNDFVGPANWLFVAYGGGPKSGVLGQGTWTASVRYFGPPCRVFTAAEAPGEIVNIDQGDFKGGTQAYAADAGYGSGLKLDVSPPRKLTFGMLYGATTAGQMSFKYDVDAYTPAGGTLGKSQIYTPFAAPGVGHTFHFGLDYAGVDPLAVANYVELDVPKI